MIKEQSVIFVTGGAKGMGLEIAREALQRGYRVVATARKPELIEQKLGKHDSLLAVHLDLQDKASIEKAVSAAQRAFGGIDILINNAGFGLLGYFEECSDSLIRQQFETNFFGTINLTRSILPIMRQQKSGYIVTTTSTSGIRAVEGDSIYAASKFALEGWMEGLSMEVSAYGIQCLILEPGAFRTNFFKEGTSFVSSDLKIDDYNERREKLHAHFVEWDGKQDGNPVKLAVNLFKVLEHENPPLRLLISKSAYSTIDAYHTKRYAEFQKWRDVTVDTEFD